MAEQLEQPPVVVARGDSAALAVHFNHGERLPRDAMYAAADLWRPWRSVATWYLWRSLDPIPVEY